VNVTTDNPNPTRQAETAVGSTGVALGRNKVIAMTKETADVTRTDFVTQSGGALRSATVVAAQGSSATSRRAATNAGGSDNPTAAGTTNAVVSVPGMEPRPGSRPGVALDNPNIKLSPNIGGNRTGSTVRYDPSSGAVAGTATVAGVRGGKPGGTGAGAGGAAGPGRTAGMGGGGVTASTGGAANVAVGGRGSGGGRGPADAGGPSTTIKGGGGAGGAISGVKGGTGDQDARGGGRGGGGGERGGSGVNAGPVGGGGRRGTGTGDGDGPTATGNVKEATVGGGGTPDRKAEDVKAPEADGNADKVESSTPAELRSGPTPIIPPNLRSDSLKGTVRARFTVMPNGRCSVELTSGTGNSQVDANILSTLRRWSWKPATKNGKPVESTVNQTISVEVR
jgi:TonB family protein